MKWPVRNLLNPVVTRSLIFGTNPFDMEYVLQKIDKIERMSGKEIKRIWFGEWERKAANYIKYAEECEKAGSRISAENYYMLTAQCWYAAYMINTDDIDQKNEVYKKLEKYYRKAVSFRRNKTEYIEIPIDDGKLTGYIHFPDGGDKGKYPCTIVYSGVGGCKEELEILASPICERGSAVLALDMPGTGSSLFDYGLQANGKIIDDSFEAIYDYIDKREDIDSSRIANCGLCMGGGFAFHATSKIKNTKCCVSIFPLFISTADIESVPIWMKQGKWATYQQGENFFEDMNIIGKNDIDSDFLLIYSADDNWMNEEASLDIFNKAKGFRKKIEIDEKPAYVSEETIMHAMPVGEQFHWVKHIAADFIAERIVKEN